MRNDVTTRYGKLVCYVAWITEALCTFIYSLISDRFVSFESVTFIVALFVGIIVMVKIDNVFAGGNRHFQLIFYFISMLLALIVSVKLKSVLIMVLCFGLQWILVVFFFNKKLCFDLALFQICSLMILYLTKLFDSRNDIISDTDLILLIVFVSACGWVTNRLISVLVEQQKQNNNQRQSLDDLVNVVEVVCNETRIASDDKAEFITELTYIINKSLKTIHSMNEMISSETDIDRIREYSDRIAQYEQNLKNINDEVIIYSDIEQKKIEITRRQFDFGEMFEQIYCDFKQIVLDEKLSLVFEISEDFPRRVTGDDVQIDRIIRILVDNAVKYTDRGTVNIKAYIGTGHFGGNRIQLCVDVEDTGRGIRTRDLENIFNPFYRVEEINSLNNNHAGLGLYIAAKLSSLLDGKLSVSSEYGKGSSFHFEFLVGKEKDKELADMKLIDYLEKCIDKSDTTEKENNVAIIEETSIISENREESSGLPYIPGIDWDVARGFLPTDQVIIFTLTELYRTGYENAKQVREYYDRINDGDNEAVELFKIKVHAIKSNLKMIGATELSERAKELEYAAKDKNLEFIHNNTSGFLDDYVELIIGVSKIPEVSGQNNSIKNAFDKDKVCDDLGIIREAMESFDTELADNTMKELETFEYPKEIGVLIGRLGNMVVNLDTDGANDIIASIMESLK